MVEGSSEEARSGTMTAMILLYVTLIVNLWIYYDPALLDGWFRNHYWWDYSWHSHNYTTFTSMFVSLYTHADLEHVLGNMFGLWMAGRRVFRYTPCWTSPWSFLWVYLGSQVTSVAGCRLLSYWLDQEWKRKITQGRVGWMTWVPIPWRDAYSTLFNVSQVAQLRFWQFVPIVGASAAVYGVVGAQIYTALLSKRHPAKMRPIDQLFWFSRIAMEFGGTPFSLDEVSLLLEDNIDHASHLFGFVGGFLLAATWEYCWHRDQGPEEGSTDNIRANEKNCGDPTPDCPKSDGVQKSVVSATI
jgi:membrane associated rhomboid family serine protease